MRAFFEHPVTFLCCFNLLVAISGIFSAVFYVVAGPLVRGWERECVAKAFFVVFVGGGAPESTKRGRTTPAKKREFDSTMGFPGEDVAAQLLLADLSH